MVKELTAVHFKRGANVYVPQMLWKECYERNLVWSDGLMKTNLPAQRKCFKVTLPLLHEGMCLHDHHFYQWLLCHLHVPPSPINLLFWKSWKICMEGDMKHRKRNMWPYSKIKHCHRKNTQSMAFLWLYGLQNCCWILSISSLNG